MLAWWPVLVAEVLLVIAVLGGVGSLRDRTVLAHGETVRATVTDTSRWCKGSDCTFVSYGDYVVGGTAQRHVELRCCASRPLAGTVAVKVDPSSPRRPVLAGAEQTRDLVLAAAALVVLVVGNALLVARLRRRRIQGAALSGSRPGAAPTGRW